MVQSMPETRAAMQKMVDAFDRFKAYNIARLDDAASHDQPTPGEVLNGESVRLLLPGDVLEAVEATCSFAVGERVVVESLQEWGSYLEVNVSGLSWMPSRFTFISRPQPSGGQDGGGERDEAFCEAYYAAHLDRAWKALRDRVPYQVNADGAISLIQQAAADRKAVKALASPAKATGWPSRELLSRLREWIVREVPIGTESATYWVMEIDRALAPTTPIKAETP